MLINAKAEFLGGQRVKMDHLSHILDNGKENFKNANFEGVKNAPNPSPIRDFGPKKALLKSAILENSRAGKS